MDERINRIAALTNLDAYDHETVERYVDGAPHIKHASLRLLYGKMVTQVFDFARQYTSTPMVLDLGAGEGSVSLPFLELGAKVVAIDISSSQLDVLQSSCERFSNRLEVRCEDINETLRDKTKKYDIIVANSFLHHVPDYLGMIREAIMILTPHGQIFCFQDPLRYDTVSDVTMIFTKLAYFSWRVFKGDIVGGIRRHLRRGRGIYLEESVHDVEYHAIRNGVDQDAICSLFKEQDFDCDVVSYFSTPSRFFQPIGTKLGMKNTFCVAAKKCMNKQPLTSAATDRFTAELNSGS